ncbi:MAG: hypothetical protein JO276_15385 [Sphingomonadaceae bacterium]|nr:hypothetical protein [Sphingomonadaceae bacterium]
MKRIAPALALVLAAAALPAQAAPARAGPVETISYETGPCFGRCPVYRVTVRSDGRGSFEGIRFTAFTGTRPFRLTRAQYLAFARRLAPDRPAQGERHYQPGTPLCRQAATDLPSVSIVWRGRGAQSLYVYYGCDRRQNGAMFDRLSSAPALLPIGDFIAPTR